MNDNKISVTPDTIYLEDLLINLNKGVYQIPRFQRNLIWDYSQMRDLLDSIREGYPIGSLLFWETQANYGQKSDMGAYPIPPQSNQFFYILDGVQRISTLFSILSHPTHLQREPKDPNLKKFTIFFDIKANGLTYTRKKGENPLYYPYLYEVYDQREIFKISRKIDRENLGDQGEIYQERLQDLHNALRKYRIPFVLIKGGDLKSSIQIFSRINSKGTKVSETAMLSALTYNQEQDFILTDEIHKICQRLKPYNFDKIKPDTILNCISNFNGKVYFDVKMEEIEQRKAELPQLLDQSFIHIEKAVQFLYEKLHVIDVRLLPYPAQLIFISEYFRLNPNPTVAHLKALEQWFWITTYGNYFTLYSLSQQRSSYKVFCDFALGNHDNGIYTINGNLADFTVAKYPKKLDLTAVRPKALRLFYLRSIIQHPVIPEESIHESYFKGSDKNPANVILRLNSEVEAKISLKPVPQFIQETDLEVLHHHFIDERIQNLCLQDYEANIGEIRRLRQEIWQAAEQEFVKSLGLTYNLDDYTSESVAENH